MKVNMPKFTIVNHPSDITLSKEWDSWDSSAKFNSKNRVVDAKGKTVKFPYTGDCYKIIEKRERRFSTLERIERGLLGIILVIFTVFLALFSKSVRKLFTKPTENIRFGIGCAPPRSPDKEEFENYLKGCKKGVILDSQKLDATLERVAKYIEEDLFTENYDGFHTGQPGPTYSGIKLFDMFEFSATSRLNWKMKLHLSHQFKLCFNPQEEETAADIVKTYLTSRFKEKIQDIKIVNKEIHITWKS